MAASYVADGQALQNVNASTVTFSFAAGTADAIACFVALTPDTPTVSTITFNTTENLALIGGISNTAQAPNSRIEAWGVAPSVGGTHNVVVTLTGSNAAWDASAVSINGANQTGGAATFAGVQTGKTQGATANHITLTVTGGTAGDVVLDCGVNYISGNPTTSSPGTQIFLDGSGSCNILGAQTAGGASVAVTENWDASNDFFSMIAFNVVQSVAGGAAFKKRGGPGVMEPRGKQSSIQWAA